MPTVSVRLLMLAQQYIAESGAAAAATDRITAAQRRLAGETKKTKKTSDEAGKSASSWGTAWRYSAIGLAAVGAAGVALKAVPPLLAATAAGAAALPGVLGGAAADVGVLKIALNGVGDELSKIYKVKDPFTELAPSAKLLVGEAAKLRPALTGFAQGIQQQALTGTAQELDALATHTLPAVSGGVKKLAVDWSHAFREITLAALDPKVVGAFNTVTSSADRFFDQINAQIVPTAGAIATLVTAADPLVRVIGDRLNGAITAITAKIEGARRSGSLAAYFDKGAKSAGDLLSIGGSVVRIVGEVISETTKQAGTLSQGAASLKAYVDSGRAVADVAGIVHTLTVAAGGLMLVVGPLGEVLRDALADPATADTLATIFSVLAAGAGTVQALFTVLQSTADVLNAIGSVVGLGQLGDVFQAAAVAAIVFVVAGKKVAVLLAEIDVKAAAAGAKLETMGVLGAGAGAKLTGLVSGAGRLVAVLAGIQLGAAALSSVVGTDLPAQTKALSDGLLEFARTGKAGGDAARLLGDDLSLLKSDLKVVDTGIPTDIGNKVAGFVEGITGTGKLFDESLENARARLSIYDQTLSSLVASGHGDQAAEIFGTISDVAAKQGVSVRELNLALPSYSNAMQEAAAQGDEAGQAAAAAGARMALLKTDLKDVAAAGREVLRVFDELNGGTINFTQAEVEAEQAVSALRQSLHDNGLGLNRQKTDFNLATKAGQANITALIASTSKAAAAADARKKNNGTIEQASQVYETYLNKVRRGLLLEGAQPKLIEALLAKYGKMPDSFESAGAAAASLNGKLAQIPKGHRFVFDGTQTLIDAEGHTVTLKDALKGVPAGKTFTFNGRSIVDAKGHVYELKAALDALKSPTITPRVDTAGAANSIAAIDHRLQLLDGKTATTYVRTVAKNFVGPLPPGVGYANADGGVYIPRQRGGVGAAEKGLLQPEYYPAGDRPRYMFAEPQTRGELFLPRAGIDVKRGQGLLRVAASWYHGMFTPMAAGGVRGAVSGLVNVAPASSSGVSATRLDYAEAALAARNAVSSLNDALKTNGRSLALATSKGKENRGELFQGIRAAQAAAKSKYDETRSVQAADAAYAAYIGRLRRVLAQQGVNARTVRSLLALAGPPEYDTKAKAPTNSLTNIAFARSMITADAGVQELRDALSLNRPGLRLGTDNGRGNLTAILNFVESAAAVAQDRYAQTANVKLSTSVYDSYIRQLRGALTQAGYGRAAIDRLVRDYGRITLVPNAVGGVYMAGRGLVSLDKAGYFPGGGPTLYGFREPSTRGELFVPRQGEQERGRDLLQVGAGWYGGRIAWDGAGGGGSVEHHTHLHVTPRTMDLSLSTLDGYMRQLSAMKREGRRR